MKCFLAALLVGAVNAQVRPSRTGPCSFAVVRAGMTKVTTPCRKKGSRQFMATCDERCAAKFIPFWHNVSHCPSNSMAARVVKSATLVKLAKSCKKVGHSRNATACSTTLLYPFLMECARYTQEALKDGKLDAADQQRFCISPCYTEAKKFSKCKNRGSALFARSIAALAGSESTCKSSGAGTTTLPKLVTKIQTNCAAQTATVLAKGSCKGKCFRSVRHGIAKNFSVQIKALPTYKRIANLVAYCNANRTNAECKSSKNLALNQVMTMCCGKGAKKCAAGKLPKNCTSTCSGAFLPFYSECGRTVFKGKQLHSMVHFARTCAKQNGRYVPTSTSTAIPTGPDPKDFCSRISNCTQCHGKCGWCRNEVQNKKELRATHGGWCSSICQTTNGECKGRIGFGSKRPTFKAGEVGKQCFDHINNDGKKGTDCEDCGCIHQFRSYCLRKLKLTGKTAPKCKGGKGGKGGKGNRGH